MLRAILCLAALLALPARANPDVRHTRIIWLGNSGGVSGHFGRNRAHIELASRVGKELKAVHPVDEGPNTFARAGRIAFAQDGLNIARFHEFLKHGPFERRQIGALPVITSPFEVVFEHPATESGAVLDLLGGPALLQGSSAESARLVHFENTRGETLSVIELPGVDPKRPLHGDPLDWELRFGFIGDITTTAGDTSRLFNVGRPVHDGARWHRTIAELKAAAPAETLLISAGENVEHFSFIDTGSPDRQRKWTWKTFGELGFDAIAPGAAEAAFGLDTLAREAQAAEVMVLGANIDGDTPFNGWRLVEKAGVQVLLIGLANPQMPHPERLRGFGEHAITAPGPAVNAAVEAARRRLGRRPDLVVVFGVLSASERAALQDSSAEIDLLLTEFGDGGLTPEVVHTRIDGPRRQILRARERHPITVVPVGRTRLGLVDVRLERDASGRLQITEATSRALLVTGEVVPDPVVLRDVQGTRQAAYAELQVPLLPDLGPGIENDPTLNAEFQRDELVRLAARGGGKVPGRVTAELWRHLTTNVLLDRFEAEIALMPPLPVPWGLTGPIGKLEAAANLNVPDDLVAVQLTAKQLLKLLKVPALKGLVTAGMGRSKKGPTVLGRLVVQRERYRVVTTDAIIADPSFAKVFGGLAVQRRFVVSGESLRARPEGRRLKLRDLVVDSLQARSGDTEGLLRLMQPASLGKRSRWVIDLQDITFSASQYGTFGPRDAYGAVPETRVTTPANITVATSGDLLVSREASTLNWVNRLRFEFAEARYDEPTSGGETEKETADKVIFGTELQLPGRGLWGSAPYGSVNYLTEFTPTDAEDGSKNPRKRRLEGATGLVWKGKVLKEARLATVVAHDFGQDTPDPEIGALALIRSRVRVGPLWWATNAEARYYVPGIGEDSDFELGAWLKLRTALDVPVAGGLAFGVFTDLFAYRGQIAATSDPGASLITGLHFKFNRHVKPGY